MQEATNNINLQLEHNHMEVLEPVNNIANQSRIKLLCDKTHTTCNIKKKQIQKPLLKWAGGKSQLLNHFMERVPRACKHYYEPFVGGGSTLLAILDLKQKGHITIEDGIFASDANESLIHFYKNVQNNLDALYNEISHIVNEFRAIPHTNKTDDVNGITDPETLHAAGHHRAAYYYEKRQEYNTIESNESSSIQKSALFYFLNKTNHGGSYRESTNSGYNIPFGWNRNVSLKPLTEWKTISKLFQDVQFTCCDFSDVLDGVQPNDFCYVDPPYVKELSTSFVGYTLNGFTIQRHQQLFQFVRTLANRDCLMLMSNSNTPLVKNSFMDFDIVQVDARRAINVNDPSSRTKEVFIRNYV